MFLKKTDLFAGEAVKMSKGAGFLISLDDWGLSPIVGKQTSRINGIEGKESIGGVLHVTNYRLIFNSHPLNRVCGRFSILLPTIKDIQANRRGIMRQMDVVTAIQTFVFRVNEFLISSTQSINFGHRGVQGSWRH